MNQKNLYQTMHIAEPAYRDNNQGIAIIEDWIGLVEEHSLVLEIGCGNGKLCDELASRGFTGVFGFDICNGIYERSGNYDFREIDVTESRLPAKDDLFDYCLSFDVLEHIAEEQLNHVLLEMQRVSRHMVISVACYGSAPLHLTVKSPGWWLNRLLGVCTETNWQVLKVFDRKPGRQVALFYGKKKG